MRCTNCDYAANTEAVRVPLRRRCPSTTRPPARGATRRHADDPDARRPAQRPRRPGAARSDVDGGRHVEERRRQAAPPGPLGVAAGHRRARRPRRRHEAAGGAGRARPRSSRSPRTTSPRTRRSCEGYIGPGALGAACRPACATSSTPRGRHGTQWVTGAEHRRPARRPPHRRAGLHRRRHDRGRRGARRRPVPGVRLAAGDRPGHRDRPHLPARAASTPTRSASTCSTRTASSRSSPWARTASACHGRWPRSPR